MKPDLEVEPTRPDNRVRNVALNAGALLVVFLLGFVPMWLRARQATGSLAKAETHNKTSADAKRSGVSGDRRTPGRL